MEHSTRVELTALSFGLAIGSLSGIFGTVIALVWGGAL